jgi:rod shape-determining protein MreC
MPRNKVAWRRMVFVILIIASLALLTLSLRETDSGPVYAIQQAGAGLLSPLQSWGATVAKPFQDGYEWIRTLWSAHEEAERLARQLQELQGEAIKLREQAEENARLKGLLDLRDKGTFPEGTDFMVARVIGKSPTRWEAWIQIDKGTADGVRVGQPVVGATPMAADSLSGKGLVGKVISATGHTAQVLLITDSQSSVAAKIQGPRAEGIVEGSISGALVMDFVDRDIIVEPKLVVVTSGYGGIFPPGIPIGIVANVGEEDVNIYKEIEIRSFVDFRILEEVMVLRVPSTDLTAETGSSAGSSSTGSSWVESSSTASSTTLSTAVGPVSSPGPDSIPIPGGVFAPTLPSGSAVGTTTTTAASTGQ